MFAIPNTSFEQRASAQSCGVGIVFHRSGQPPLRVDHEELAPVRATLDAVEDSGRVHRDTNDEAELQLWDCSGATQWQGS